MYGIEYTTVLTFLISVILLNYVLKSLTRIMDFIIYRFLLIIVILSPLLNAQNYGINLPITGSMDTPYTNSTREEVFLTSTLCLYYPTEAATEINDNSWKDTLSQLFLIKGWPTGSIYFKDYTDIASFSVDPQLYCDYNLVLMKYDATLQLDMSELADLLLNEWLCNPMDITLYYYQQTDEANKWISMGSSCTIKVCPLNTQTLGIGCLTTDTNTFEEVATAEKLVITDVVDGVNHKLNVTTNTCTIRNCKKLGPRENVAVIQVGGPDVLDITADPTTMPQTERMMRVNWKKWWQVFYTIVDYVNQIVQAMSKRSRSLNSAAFYYRV
ncbi:outer capsid protein [Human rotavirus A]|uniref:Outer capsid glycoprotein VP7 n=91 Tax=Rotavirus A TaxID=28875 RepID=Q0GC14_9REOV|nr:outer capsid protein [Rotavirus G3]ABI34080.1 outer capsid protein [Human rotavirus A]ACX45386.1 VP7 [Rotavirus A]AEB80022.1 glycoprotein VP7 [Rotavirus A human/Vanderbilt/VU06-07-21/2006/G3P[8]]AEB80035.1 glycoprotein VP7 [Rotavirus A human/Vanderbilt/VU08-09-22/2008/G3P[8]]UAW74421.1 MAG: major outer capsid protein VP7 [Reoviridae sp.]BAJ19438.1 outer capsid protein [Rotavirus A Hu/NhaTrang/V88/2006/VNM/G3]BAJ19439.1 outer capsid protein [Rotavirus A Hu/NhaTrang/V141/2006/VNM/G3]BAJ194